MGRKSKKGGGGDKLLLLFSCSAVSDSLQPHGLQHTSLPCPSLSPGAGSNFCPLSQWCHPTISSSVCCPFLLLPQSFPSSGSFPSELALTRWPKYWSISICSFNEYSGLIYFKIDWFDHLAVQETLKSPLQHQSLKASILRSSAFFMVQLSYLYMTTGKNTALTTWTFVSKVMSLLVNTLCHSFSL